MTFSCPYCQAPLAIVAWMTMQCTGCGAFTVVFELRTGDHTTVYGSPPELQIERTPVPRAFADAFGEEELTP